MSQLIKAVSMNEHSLQGASQAESGGLILWRVREKHILDQALAARAHELHQEMLEKAPRPTAIAKIKAIAGKRSTQVGI